MQTQISVRKNVLNQIPKELEDKLSPLTNRVVLRTLKQRTAVRQIPLGNETVQNEQVLIDSFDFLRKKWPITYNNNTYMVGFVVGDNGEKEIFAHPAFKQGVMVLNPARMEDHIIYKWIQLYPGNRDGVIKDGSTPMFYVEDKEADAKKELERLDRQEKATNFISSLKKAEIEALSNLLKLHGGETIRLATLKKMCLSDPDTILGYKEDMANLERRATIQAAFNLEILKVDFDSQLIRFSDNLQASMEFDPNFPDEKQQQAYEDNLIRSIKTTEGKKAYEQVLRRVEAHVMNQNAKGGAGLKEVPKKATDTPQIQM